MATRIITAAQKEAFKKASYTKKEWSTSKEDTFTLEEYAELIDSRLSHISGNPTIIAKERKDGNIFLKMMIPLSEGAQEFDLPYEHDFEEGDEIDKDTLIFGIERFLDTAHGYATGELAE